jgi:hypothetical protein
MVEKLFNNTPPVPSGPVSDREWEEDDGWPDYINWYWRICDDCYNRIDSCSCLTVH